MASVKWLTEISAVARPFEGFQQTHAYRLRQREDEPGEELTRMRPRALMIPPGMPDYPGRHRFVEAGPQQLQGRAWSGFAPITEVEVSTDGGGSWETAAIQESPSPWAWVGWSHPWQAEVGERELMCRARDAAGNEQPLEPAWNLGGYANNAAQRVRVTVR